MTGYSWENALEHHGPAPYPHHMAAAGIPEDWQPEHDSGTCAWCDAIRWRRWTAWLALSPSGESMVKQLERITGSIATAADAEQQ